MNSPESTGTGGPAYHNRPPDGTGDEPRRGHAGSGRPRKRFGRNRSIIITAIDVGFVLLLFGIYHFFLAPDPSRVDVGGITAVVEAFEFNREVYLTVTVSVDSSRSGVDGESDLLGVEFADGTSVLDVLPASPEVPVFVRHIMTGADADAVLEEGSVGVQIRIQGEESLLVARIGRSAGD